MPLIGEQFWTMGSKSKSDVQNAVVTADRLTAEWHEFGQDWRLEAESTDGIHYVGRYGSPQPTSEYALELQLYRSGDRIAFIGTWKQKDTEDTGMWVIALREE